MSHFAKVENGLVTQVVVAEQDFIDAQEGTWVQTSYNTHGGVHYSPETGEPDGGVALRKNYAGVGDTYDSNRDAFYEPKVYPSWVLNEASCLWEAPIPMPEDGNAYDWDEDSYQQDNTSGWVIRPTPTEIYQ
jgi:hypothetical protein